MRNLVILVALLAAAKIGYQEYLFRVSAREVIVATYQERALQTCQKQAKGGNAAPHTTAWNKPSSVSLVIGKSNLDVYFWQINNSMWNARYRNPYLFIVAEEKPAYVFCEYDILNGAASVYRM
jgi:hypothetical protein